MPRTVALAGAIALLALAPYAGLPFPFELGMYVQTGVVLAVIAAVAATSEPRALRRLSELPWPVRNGLALYAAVAVWGAAIGVLSGNPTRYVAGQTVSMLLLPLAAAAFSAHRDFGDRELCRGLAVAALLAASIHLALGRPPAGSVIEGHLKLPFNISFTGGVVLVVIVLGAAQLSAGSPLLAAGGLAALALLVGGMSRGAWVSVIVGLLIMVALRSVPNRRLARRAVAVAAALATVAAVSMLWVARARTEIVDMRAADAVPGEPAAPPGAAPRLPLPAEFALVRANKAVEVMPRRSVSGRGLWFHCTVAGPAGGRARFSFIGRDEAGSRILAASVVVVGRPEEESYDTVVRLPPGVRTVRLMLSGSAGSWRVGAIRVASLDSTAATWAASIQARFASLVDTVAGRRIPETIRYRIRETRAVGDAWARTGPLRRVLGAGLGARFAFENSGWDANGRRVALLEASYIHNFYVFLGYKLGVAGLLALAGLLAVAGWNAVGALNPAAGTSWIRAAAAGCWIAYLLWSVSSPEIIDFRVAPLLGALTAAAARPEPGASGDRSRGRTVGDGGPVDLE